MKETVTVTWRDCGLRIKVPPFNYVAIQQHSAFHGIFEATLENQEALADVRDLEETRLLYESRGAEAFLPYRGR